MSAAKSTPIEAAEVPFARARAHAGRAEGRLSSSEMIRAPHSEVEALCEAEGREWARLVLEEHLALRAAQEKRVEVTGADGVARGSVRDSERHLETLVGTVAVPRYAYQAPGSEDLHPMDATLNLPRELFSHGIRKLVAKEVARASFDEVVEMVHDWCGASIAKRQVEELAVRAAQDFDAFYEQREPAHEPATDLLVLSTDGKGIVMRHADLREATRLAAEKKVNKLETRLAPGEKNNRKRMAQVATVYSVAPWPRTAADVLRKSTDKDLTTRRPVPHDKRVWASVEKQPRKVIRAAFDEALGRDPERRRRWVVLVDGEPKQLAAVKAEARRAGVKPTILIDAGCTAPEGVPHSRRHPRQARSPTPPSPESTTRGREALAIDGEVGFLRRPGSIYAGAAVTFRGPGWILRGFRGISCGFRGHSPAIPRPLQQAAGNSTRPRAR